MSTIKNVKGAGRWHTLKKDKWAKAYFKIQNFHFLALHGIANGAATFVLTIFVLKLIRSGVQVAKPPVRLTTFMALEGWLG